MGGWGLVLNFYVSSCLLSDIFILIKTSYNYMKREKRKGKGTLSGRNSVRK